MEQFIQAIQALVRLSLENGVETPPGVYVPASPGSSDHMGLGLAGPSMQPDLMGDTVWREVRSTGAVEFVVCLCTWNPETKRDDAILLVHHHLNGPVSTYRLAYDLEDGRPVNIGVWTKVPLMEVRVIGNPWLDHARNASILGAPAPSFTLPEPFAAPVAGVVEAAMQQDFVMVPTMFMPAGSQVVAKLLSRTSRGGWYQFLPEKQDCVILTNLDARVGPKGLPLYDFPEDEPTVDYILHIHDRRIQAAYVRLCITNLDAGLPPVREAGAWHEAGEDVVAYWNEILYFND